MLTLRDATVERFWRKVGPPDSNGCRLFLGGRRRGYGVVFAGYGHDSRRACPTIPAQAVAWRTTYQGPVRPTDEFRHICDNPPCCEPSHICPGTHLQNMQDAASKGRMGVKRGA